VILKNNLDISKGDIQDIPYLIPLLKELFTIEKDFTFEKANHVEGLKLLISNKSSTVVVARFENEVIAMVTIQTIISTATGSKTGLIEDFIVKDDFRDLGVGTHLFNYLKEYAKKHHIKRLQLVCDEDNDVAKEFYTNKSFKKSNMAAWYNHLVE